MTKHLLVSGLLAGFVVALLATLLQFAFVERLVLLAERYETGELVHFQQAAVADHSHDTTAAAHLHMGDDDAPFGQRQAKTVLAMTVTYCGYALVMVAGFAFANHFGHPVPLTHGLLWGLAGFAAFSLAPAMGLELEPPGVEAAALQARQLWWIGCALATVAGLALLAYGNGVLPRIAALVLLALPHIIGAPHLPEFTGIIPPELSSGFAARSLGIGLVAWVTLGGLSVWFWDRTA